MPIAAGRALAGYARRYVVRTARRLPRANVYHLHAPYQFPAVWLAARPARTPIVYDAHDFYSGINRPEELLPHERLIIHPLYEAVERLCVRSAAAVVTVSCGVADLMERKFGRRPVVLRNTDDGRLHRVPRQLLRETLGLSRREFVIVVVGQGKSGQAWAELLSVLGSLPDDVHVVALGAGHTRLMALAKDSGVDGRVHVVGPVHPTEVVPVVAGADVGLLLYYARAANYRAALPNGFFQCVAAGLPLIYPPLPEIAQIAQRFSLGLLADPLQPGELRAAIMRLYRDNALRETLGAASSAAAVALDWRNEEPELGRIYSAVVADRNQS